MWCQTLDFFFARESPKALAVVRVILAVALLCEVLPRWRYAIELYSTAGMPLQPFLVPQDTPASGGLHFVRPGDRTVADVSPLSGKVHVPALPVPAFNATQAVVVMSVLPLFIVTMGIGWHTRLSLLLSFVLFGWIGLLDGVSTFAKHSVIALHLLGLLALSGCARVWSIDAWLRPVDPTSRVWPRRLMQLLICHVYFGAALTKLRIPAYSTGEALLFTLMDETWGYGPLSLWIATSDGILPLISVSVIAFELLFPFLIWVPACRRVLLLLALLFHLALLLTLTIGAFSIVMLAGLAAFLTPDDLAWTSRAGGWCLRLTPSLATVPLSKSRRRGVLSAAGFVALSLLVGAGGLLIQSRADWYGVFGHRRLAPPRDIPRSLAQEMLSGQLPALTHFHARSVVCSRHNLGQPWGERLRFQPGSSVFVVTRLIEPHPPLRIEGLLIDPQGREVARYRHQIEGAVHVAINGFELVSELPAGRYKVVVQFDGYEVAALAFELVK